MFGQIAGVALGLLLLIPVGFALAILGPYAILMALVHWQVSLLVIGVLLTMTIVSAIREG